MAHSIEKLTGISHGKAVATGMVLAAEISEKKGMIQEHTRNSVVEILKKAGLPVETDLSAESILKPVLRDKKRAGNTIDMILLEEIGDAKIVNMPITELEEIICDLL